MNKIKIFLIILVAILFISTLNLLYQNKNLRSPKISQDPKPGNDVWKTYPTDSTVGLPFSFKYPAAATLTEPGEGPVSITQNNSTIYFNFYGKANGIDNLINNYQPLRAPSKLNFFNKQPIISGSLSGFIMNVLPEEVIVNDTYVFLSQNNNPSQIYEFSYSSKDKNAYFMLIQILSSFSFSENKSLNFDNWVKRPNGDFENSKAHLWISVSKTDDSGVLLQFIKNFYHTNSLEPLLNSIHYHVPNRETITIGPQGIGEMFTIFFSIDSKKYFITFNSSAQYRTVEERRQESALVDQEISYVLNNVDLFLQNKY